MADAGRRDLGGGVEVAEKGRLLTVCPGKEIYKREEFRKEQRNFDFVLFCFVLEQEYE